MTKDTDDTKPAGLADAIVNHQVAQWWLDRYPNDPFTDAEELCEGGYVHSYDGACTGHAHFGDEHILCSSSTHYMRCAADMLNHGGMVTMTPVELNGRPAGEVPLCATHRGL